jgi:hypothetical protein
MYVGHFNSGSASGTGYFLFPNGDRYEGDFVKDVADDPKGIILSYFREIY